MQIEKQSLFFYYFFACLTLGGGSSVKDGEKWDGDEACFAEEGGWGGAGTDEKFSSLLCAD